MMSDCAFLFRLRSLHDLIPLRSAEFFRDWERREGRESYVNEVWVKDYAIWMSLNKVRPPLVLTCHIHITSIRFGSLRIQDTFLK